MILFRSQSISLATK